MMVDWHIQGGEVGTNCNRPIAMPVSVKMSEDVSRTRRSEVRADRTHSLDRNTAVDQQRESDRQRRRSAATIEIFVSLYIVVTESLLTTAELHLRIEASFGYGFCFIFDACCKDNQIIITMNMYYLICF